MIPRSVAELVGALPQGEVSQRLVRDGSQRFLELGPGDEDLRLGIGVETDRLGPEKVVVLWDEAGPGDDLPVGGYLIVDNLAMGRPSLGGIRLAPDVTPNMISSLARGMTLKNAAADIPFGGGKAGIVAEQTVDPERKRRTVVRFARLIGRYRDLYNPGPDVGMNDEDMAIVAMENGLDSVVSKPARMGGTEIDKCGATAAGVVVALETVLSRARQIAELPQFSAFSSLAGRTVTVIIQGFGAVGANTALFLHNRNGGGRYRVVGVSDSRGFLYAAHGLDVPGLFRLAGDDKTASHKLYLQTLSMGEPGGYGVKFSNSRDDLLRESADVLIPAAPVANYIGLDMTSDPSMIFDRIGQWHIIVEGANTLSTVPEKQAERRSVERILYRERGTFVATDYLSNSGGVIFAGHERLVPTPAEIRFPDHILGDHAACERWLGDHAGAFARLAEERRALAREKRDGVIEQNMTMLIEGLIDDASLLPSDVAETIAKSRIESQRTIERLMVREFVTVSADETLQTIAGRLKDVPSDAALVLSPQGALVGIITDWDIVLAIANRLGTESRAREIMTKDVVAFGPGESVLDVMPIARQHGYSVMPVVDEQGVVLGVIRLQDLIEI
jgi:glutamate dehydrogenase (NAD(P)+)